MNFDKIDYGLLRMRACRIGKDYSLADCLDEIRKHMNAFDFDTKVFYGKIYKTMFNDAERISAGSCAVIDYQWVYTFTYIIEKGFYKEVNNYV